MHSLHTETVQEWADLKNKHRMCPELRRWEWWFGSKGEQLWLLNHPMFAYLSQSTSFIPLPPLSMWDGLVTNIRKYGRWISPEFNPFPSCTFSFKNTAALTAGVCLLFFQQSCLSLTCFSIFSSSSSESYVDTTQCWRWLLQWALLLCIGTKKGYSHAWHVNTEIPFTSFSLKAVFRVKMFNRCQFTFIDLFWWAPVGADGDNWQFPN